MKIIYPDKSWIVGNRKWHFRNTETKGTHHYVVLDTSPEFHALIGYKIAVVIDQVQIFILDHKYKGKKPQ